MAPAENMMLLWEHYAFYAGFQIDSKVRYMEDARAIFCSET